MDVDRLVANDDPEAKIALTVDLLTALEWHGRLSPTFTDRMFRDGIAADAKSNPARAAFMEKAWNTIRERRALPRAPGATRGPWSTPDALLNELVREDPQVVLRLAAISASDPAAPILE